jgi:hypothetical protein
MYSGSQTDPRACCMAGKYKKINITIITIAATSSNKVKEEIRRRLISLDVSFYKLPFIQYNQFKG